MEGRLGFCFAVVFFPGRGAGVVLVLLGFLGLVRDRRAVVFRFPLFIGIFVFIVAPPFRRRNPERHLQPRHVLVVAGRESVIHTSSEAAREDVVAG